MNMTAFELMDAVARAIETAWAVDNKAGVTVAENPAHALELLTAGRAGGCSVVLFYLSDQRDGDEFEDDTRLDAQIRIGVVQKPGLGIRDGKATPTVLAIVDSLRKWLASQNFEGLLNGSLEYRGMTHIPAGDGSALHGYALTYGAVYAYETEEG